jgi:hypothetical protein
LTWLDEVTLSTVVVHTKDGTSIKGLKRAIHDDGLVLSDAFLLEQEGAIQLDGLQFVPRENVNFMQLIPIDGAA